MLGLKFKQLEYESESWKRLLRFIEDENIHMKNRLSAVLKNGIKKGMLNSLETFQSRFIKEDNLISLLRNDIAEFEKLQEAEVYDSGQNNKNVARQTRKLRSNIQNTREQFENLKLEFNNYLFENL